MRAAMRGRDFRRSRRGALRRPSDLRAGLSRACGVGGRWLPRRFRRRNGAASRVPVGTRPTRLRRLSSAATEQFLDRAHSSELCSITRPAASGRGPSLPSRSSHRRRRRPAAAWARLRDDPGRGLSRALRDDGVAARDFGRSARLRIVVARFELHGARGGRLRAVPGRGSGRERWGRREGKASASAGGQGPVFEASPHLAQTLGWAAGFSPSARSAGPFVLRPQRDWKRQPFHRFSFCSVRQLGSAPLIFCVRLFFPIWVESPFRISLSFFFPCHFTCSLSSVLAQILLPICAFLRSIPRALFSAVFRVRCSKVWRSPFFSFLSCP